MEKETNKFQPLNKFKELLKRVIERKSEKESENLAKEAVLLFASSDNQEPQQTFSANSPSEFDLTKLNPCCIFRTKVRPGKFIPNDGFYYYVIGKTDNNKNISAYLVSPRIKNGDKNEKLKLGPKWELKKQKHKKNVFPIKDTVIFLSNLQKQGESLEYTEELMYTEKVDIMSSGLTSKVKEQKEVSQRLPELKLATQNVN